MESLKPTRVEAEISFDNKVIGADLGYFWNSTVAEVVRKGGGCYYNARSLFS